jgi:RHS repeat-associated protein
MGNRIAKHVWKDEDWERSTYYILDAQGNQISTYDHEIVSETAQFNLKERNIYGSSRIGSKQDSLNVLTATITQNYSQTLGNKYFEFSNHLGNVLIVFSDLKIPKDTDNNNVVDGYDIGVVSTADYSPFGVELDGRTISMDSYRYGFNGMEADDEVKGQGNSYTTEFRQYDARVGRWLSLDPLMAKFPLQSPYVAFDNNPIYYVDPLGSESEGNGDKDKNGDKGKNDVKLQTKDKDGNTVTCSKIQSWFIRNQNKNVQEAVALARQHEGAKVYIKKVGARYSATVSWSETNLKKGEDITVRGKYFPSITPKDHSGEFDGTIMSILPWYNIGRGIQKAQQDDPYGYVDIGMEITPFEYVKFGGSFIKMFGIAKFGRIVTKGVGKETIEQVGKNFNKISDNLLKKSGIDAHQLKRDFLGKNAQISKYDLYKDTKTSEILILQKGGKGNPIQTGEFLK